MRFCAAAVAAAAAAAAAAEVENFSLYYWKKGTFLNKKIFSLLHLHARDAPFIAARFLERGGATTRQDIFACAFFWHWTVKERAEMLRNIQFAKIFFLKIRKYVYWPRKVSSGKAQFFHHQQQYQLLW